MINEDPRRGLPSASSLYRLSQCPGSHHLITSLRQAGKSYEVADPDRESGRLIHAYLAGKTEVDLSQEQQRTAQAAIQIRDELVLDWSRGTSFYEMDANRDFEIIREKRFWYRRGILPIFSGQPDFVVIDEGSQRAIIINFKTGRKEAQPAADNIQLRSEAVLLKYRFPELREIEASIDEPWVSWSPERVHYDQEGLAEAENEIVAIIDRSLWEWNKRVAGPWCFYCPVRPWCRESRDFVVEVVRLGAQSVDGVLELPLGEQGSKIIENIATVRKILDSMENIYKRILSENPEALSDHYLHEGAERRYLTDVAEGKARLKEAGFTEAEIDLCATYWVGKLEEVFCSKKGLKLGVKGQEGERAFTEFFAGLMEVKQGDKYLAKRSKKQREKRLLAQTSE